MNPHSPRTRALRMMEHVERHFAAGNFATVNTILQTLDPVTPGPLDTQNVWVTVALLRTCFRMKDRLPDYGTTLQRVRDAWTERRLDLNLLRGL